MAHRPNSRFENADQFEEAVRHVCRLVWDDHNGGQPELIDGRERDAVFRTRTQIHIVEATTSRNSDKLVEKASKTQRAVRDLQSKTNKQVLGWLIVREEPTAEHTQALRKYRDTVTVQGFVSFRSQLFDDTEYIRCRDRHRFGSIQNPVVRDILVAESDFVPIDFISEDRESVLTFSDVCNDIEAGESRYIILGEYGSGKSMTLRGLYGHLRDKHKRGEYYRCPLYLNLREHKGQSDPVEALERHARRIGYPYERDLVRAWRGGFCDIILDGFDEIATAGWSGDLKKVRQHRRSAMTLARTIIEETPPDANIIVAGRENYFDNVVELRSSLSARRHKIMRTSEFNDKQLAEFLKKKRYDGGVPSWLPARPLLITYLLEENALRGVERLDHITAAEGWDGLLNMICEREAQQDERLDQDVARLMLERLASEARRSPDGLGQFDIPTIQTIFHETASFFPDEAAQQFILRLPGLGPSSEEHGARTFVDRTLANCSASGDFVRYVQSPYSSELKNIDGVVVPLEDLSIELAAYSLSSSSNEQRLTEIALEKATEQGAGGQIILDIVKLMQFLDIERVSKQIFISDASVGHFHISSDGLSKQLKFQDCLFDAVEIEYGVAPDELPAFEGGYVEEVIGISGHSVLTSSFSDIEVGRFVDTTETNASVLRSDVDESVKALVTVLRKLFIQKGNRKENAFLRGAMSPSVQRLIPDVLAKIKNFDFAVEGVSRGNKTWIANGRMSARAHRIIASPIGTDDPLLEEVRKL